MNIKPIKNENDYTYALQRAEELFDALPNTVQGDELEILITLIERYEALNYHIDTPRPHRGYKVPNGTRRTDTKRFDSIYRQQIKSQ